MIGNINKDYPKIIEAFLVNDLYKLYFYLLILDYIYHIKID